MEKFEEFFDRVTKNMEAVLERIDRKLNAVPGWDLYWLLRRSQVVMVACGAVLKAIAEDLDKKVSPVATPKSAPPEPVSVTPALKTSPVETPPIAKVMPVETPLVEAPEKAATRRRARQKRESPADQPRILGNPILLSSGQLVETEDYPGCYALLDEQPGLSFRGLPNDLEITFDKHGEYVCKAQSFQPLQASPAWTNRLRLLLALWESWQSLLALEVSPIVELKEIDAARSVLTQAYEEFQHRYGRLADNPHLLKFEDTTDPRLSMLLSLESDKAAQGYKADIFFTRSRFPDDLREKIYDEISEANLMLAMVKSTDLYGSVNGDAIADWFGCDVATIQKRYTEAGICYLMPKEAKSA